VLRTFAAALPPREEHLAPRFGRLRYRAKAKYGEVKIKRGGLAAAVHGGRRTAGEN
jgi:hypothetical protein